MLVTRIGIGTGIGTLYLFTVILSNLHNIIQLKIYKSVLPKSRENKKYIYIIYIIKVNNKKYIC